MRGTAVSCRRLIAGLLVALAWAALSCTPALASPYAPQGALSDPQSAGGALGQSVSVSGDGTLAVVGEPDAGGGVGAAVIYTKQNGGWVFTQRLTATGETGAGRFGQAVGIDPEGQAVIVGAPRDSAGVGAAFAFALQNGVWTQQSVLTGGGAEIGAGQFGASVAVASSGQAALIGAPMSNNATGQVWTFECYPGDGWFRFQRMDLAGVSAGAHFGASVALSSNATAAIVGAPNMNGGDGAVFPFTIFGLESPYWVDHDALTAPVSGGHFGQSVAMSAGGDVFAIGAPDAASGGAAFTYRPSGAQLSAQHDPGGADGDLFGQSVALAARAGDELLVGAPGTNIGAGAVYVYDDTSAQGFFTGQSAALPGAGGLDGYGQAVGLSADGTGALVGSPGQNGSDGAAVSFDAPVAPDMPGSPSASAGAESASVSWTAPASDGGSPVTGYEVTSWPASSGCRTSGLSCTVAGLTDGVAYMFFVTATNLRGTSTPANSGEMTPFTVPGAPVSVSASAGAGSATVSWAAPGFDGGSPVSGYEVTSIPGGFHCSIAGLSCTVSRLTTGMPYAFTVSAANAAGASAASEQSNTVTPTRAGGTGGGTGGVGGGTGGGNSGGGGTGGGGSGGGSNPGGGSTRLVSPLGPLRLLARTRTSMTLAWKAPGGQAPAGGYRIDEYVHTTWTLVTRTARVSFTVRKLRRGTRHRFEVRSLGAHGELSAPLRSGWLTTAR